MLRNTAVAVAWRHRGLLRELITRDIQNRYAGSVVGVLWALLHPIAMLAVYAVVFEYIFSVRTPNAMPNQPYVLFVATALWPWLAFSESSARASANSLPTNFANCPTASLKSSGIERLPGEIIAIPLAAGRLARLRTVHRICSTALV